VEDLAKFKTNFLNFIRINIMNNTMISNRIDTYAYLKALGFKAYLKVIGLKPHLRVTGYKLLAVIMLTLYLLIPLAHADFNKHELGAYFPFEKKVVEVDIVENPRKFSFDETPAFEDGSPAYGGEFITQGFIYPKGTLEMGDGVDVNGNPQFPDLVIGTWFCRGWHIGDGAHTQTGPIVITHQIFNFGEKFGAKTIATDGVELADIGEPIKRAITGGTGRYKRARGEQVQTLEGFNQFESEQGALVGVRLRVKLNVSQ
jgi:hypothetical protein